MADEMIRLAMQKDLEAVSDRLTEVEEKIGDMSGSEEFIALEQKVDDLAETAATEEYVDAQIQLVTSTGIPKLMVYELHITATIDDQTDFEIALDTFDTTTDTIMVQSNGLMLFPEVDYTVNENVLSLNTGVATGTVVGIYVFKNVPLGDNGSVSGSVIGTGTLPLDRLAEMPSAEDVGAAEVGHVHTAEEIGARPDTWMPTAEQVGALPNTGGMLSGPLNFNGKATVQQWGNVLDLISSKDNIDENRTQLHIGDDDALTTALKFRRLRNGEDKGYNIFGEHNKPSGSYTGNGSATERVINTGAMGRLILIRGGVSCTLVGVIGAISWGIDGVISGVKQSEITYEHGVLTIKSSNGLFNSNGATYYYQCI